MRDPISIPRVAELDPHIRDEVKALIEKAETHLPATQAIRVVQGVRSWEYQDGLYAQGRTKPGKIVTNAKGGSSWHNFALAFDLAIVEGKSIIWDIPAVIVSIFKTAGYEWGGDFKSIKDKPHFQKTFGWTLKQAREAYKKGAYLPINPTAGS